MRQVILAAALLMTGLLAFLTVSVVVKEGPDPLTLVSLVVIALFGFGIVGALREPPPE